MGLEEEVAFRIAAREYRLLDFAYKADNRSGFITLKIEKLADRTRRELIFTGVHYVTIPAIEVVEEFSVVAKTARLRNDASQYSVWARFGTGDLLLMFTAKTFALS